MSSITKPLFGKRLPFIGELWETPAPLQECRAGLKKLSG
jgi:hypothetical protein